MISIIFHDVFSRFPEGVAHEDEGKVLSYEDFGRTAKYLKQNNIDSFSENLPDDLKDRGVYCSSKYDKVIVVSRSIVVEQMLYSLVQSNVYYYGGLAITKNVVLDFLKRKGFNVPDFVVSPSTREELFDKLGDDIVAKPIEYLTQKGKLVHRISQSTKNIDLNRWLFQKYVGKKIQPSWTPRVNSLFGKNISYHSSKYSIAENESYDKISKLEYYAKAWLEGAKFLTTKVDDEILDISKKVSKELTTHFRCGIIGIDFVTDDFNIPWIVECNSSNVSLRSGKSVGYPKRLQAVVDKLDLDYKPVDSILNTPKLISEACVNFIENLI
tara:strand:+ start:1799 stop:2776 length:978 start_codon:yes stop_codon:yes gene_type:complete